MLDKEKCMYLVKTAQFDELNKFIEEEYVSLFDNYLKNFNTEEELSKISFPAKVKLIIREKPELEIILLRIINAYLSDDEDNDNVDNINTLLNMYKVISKLLVY